MDAEPVESFVAIQVLRGLTVAAVSVWFLVNAGQHKPTHVRDGVHAPVLGSEADVEFATETARVKLHGIPSQQQPRDVDNHATVEFLENGQLADACPTGRTDGRPCQLHHAIKFLGKAYAKALDEDSALETLNVIVYVHGNENWASEYADNYPHFRQTINCLNLGTKGYKDRYGATITAKTPWKAPGTSDVLTCYNLAAGKAADFNQKYDESDLREIPAPQHQKFVGIFLGWRGNVTNTLMNVREKTALKVATSDHSQFVSALYALRDAAKSNHPEKVRFILIGHSFGGLIVEQAMIRIYEEAYGRDKGEVYMPCQTPAGTQGIRPFSDQVITIAAAAHAVEAQKLLNNFLVHREFCGSDRLTASMFRPLMIAFVAKKDFWSYGFGSGLRHLVGGEQDKVAKFEEMGDTEVDKPDDSTVNWSTSAVVTYMQNFCFLQRHFNNVDNQGHRLTGLEREAACDAERNTMMDENEARVFNPGIVSDESPLSNLYVRFNCKLKISKDHEDNRRVCAVDAPWNATSTVGVWNRTPYWIGAIDIDVFGGHGPFGYPRFNQLLFDLTGAFDPLATAEMLPSPKAGKFPAVAPYVPAPRFLGSELGQIHTAGPVTTSWLLEASEPKTLRNVGVAEGGERRPHSILSIGAGSKTGANSPLKKMARRVRPPGFPEMSKSASGAGVRPPAPRADAGGSGS